jgi:cephalosporin hydroxylase
MKRIPRPLLDTLVVGALFSGLGVLATLAVLARPHIIPWPLTNWATGFVARSFNAYYHAAGNQTYRKTKWLGQTLLKAPTDLFVMQEIITDVRPDVLIEAGTLQGGSALYFASIMDLLGKGRVITIDITEFTNRPTHPRITYLTGSSTDPAIVHEVRQRIREGETVMAVLDSDHSHPHVLAELHAYGPMVTQGSYLIVEDTNLNGHPVRPEYGPGPMEAVDEYLTTTDAFEIDRTREKFVLTFNPRGYLRRHTPD